MTPRHKEYWRKNLTMASMLLVAWAVLTVVSVFYARELREAAALLFAVIVAFYPWYLRRQEEP
jgi:uncharacterized membrane protein